MSASIKTLADGFDNEVYPKTKTAAVYDDNDNLLDTILSAKQNSTDSNLNTTAKTVVGAINEVDSDLGSPSSASAVTGADAFSKISKLNSELTDIGTNTPIGSFPFTPTKNGLIVLSSITPNATGDCYLYMKRTRGTTTVNFRYRAQHTNASGYGSMTIPVMAGDTVTLDTASTGTTYTAEIVAL